MKKYIFTLLSLAALSFTSCDDVLDRPQLTKPVDTNYWRSETDFRLYANECYPNYFVGYNNTWGVDYAPLRGYYFSDDNAWAGKQSVMAAALFYRDKWETVQYHMVILTIFYTIFSQTKNI